MEPSEQKVHDSWRKANGTFNGWGLLPGSLLGFFLFLGLLLLGDLGSLRTGGGWVGRERLQSLVSPVHKPDFRGAGDARPPSAPLSSQRPRPSSVRIRRFSGTIPSSRKALNCNRSFTLLGGKTPQARARSPLRHPPKKSLPKVSMHFPPQDLSRWLAHSLSPGSASATVFQAGIRWLASVHCLQESPS